MYKVNYMEKKKSNQIIFTKLWQRELLYRLKVHYKNVTLIFVFETIKRTIAHN